jgi:hypothetical protein
MGRYGSILCLHPDSVIHLTAIHAESPVVIEYEPVEAQDTVDGNRAGVE